jgi:hypothetical protein
MSLLRTALHLLLAVVLVINGVASVAMAAAMTHHDAAAASAATPTSQAQGGCHESVKQAAAANNDPADSDSECYADGRCACACVHHGTVVMAMLSPVAIVVAWPTVPAMDVAAAPSAPVAPQLRPPIARIS